MLLLKFLKRDMTLRGGSTTPRKGVVILAGNNRTGAIGLCAGRHLRNKGVPVQVWLFNPSLGSSSAGKGKTPSNGGGGSASEWIHSVTYQRQLLQTVGGLVSTFLEDLPDPSGSIGPVGSLGAAIGPIREDSPTVILDALFGPCPFGPFSSSSSSASHTPIMGGRWGSLKFGLEKGIQWTLDTVAKSQGRTLLVSLDCPTGINPEKGGSHFPPLFDALV
jgi:hypothetical protein